MVSAREKRGGRAFFAVAVPMGLALASTVGVLGYRAPLAHGPGRWLPATLCGGVLALWFLMRLVRELTRKVAPGMKTQQAGRR